MLGTETEVAVIVTSLFMTGWPSNEKYVVEVSYRIRAPLVARTMFYELSI